MNIKKYLKTFGLFLSLILFSSIIITILNYFNVISSKFSNIIEIISLILSIFISSFYLGKRSNNKGYLEGLKLSIIIILFLLLFNLGFTKEFSLSSIFYYTIVFIISIFGAVIGINKKNR